MAEIIRYRQCHGQCHAGGSIENNLEVALPERDRVGAGQRAIGSQVQPSVRRPVLVVRMQHQAAGSRDAEAGSTAGNAQAIDTLDGAEGHAAGAGGQRVERRIGAGITGKSCSPA